MSSPLSWSQNIFLLWIQPQPRQSFPHSDLREEVIATAKVLAGAKGNLLRTEDTKLGTPGSLHCFAYFSLLI